MDPQHLGRQDSWEGVRAVVAGFGVSGFAAADNLNHLGASVVALDEDRSARRSRPSCSVSSGPTSGSGRVSPTHSPTTSTWWSPRRAGSRQRRCWPRPVTAGSRSGVRSSWPGGSAIPTTRRPWLAVTGTNGKTTTVQMLDGILRAAGLRSAAVGNVGRPIVEAVMDPAPYDVFAVELSSFQLHYTDSVSAESAAVLNVAEDHLDWYGTMDDYAADKGRIYERVQRACVYNVADPTTERLVRDADVVEGARAIGFTLGTPAVGMVGVVDDVLADRAFIDDRASSAAELCTVGDLASPAPHVVANALAAAALARAHGISQAAVREGLRAFRPDGHRIATVAEADGVTWIDDSKATNPHAARSSILGYDPVVWIAGGLAKGARFDDLVTAVRDRLRGVVLLGRDRDVIAGALSRHAPDVRVISVGDGETERDHEDSGHEPMERVVEAAARLAKSGDTVLLAPGCASMDMFADYGERGDAFAAAVRRRTG